MFDGEVNQPIPAGDIQLFTDVRAMRIHGAGADAALGSNFPGRFAVRNAIENATLRSGKLAKARLVPLQGFSPAGSAQQEICQRGADVSFTSRDRGNAIQNLSFGSLFQDVALNAKTDRLVEKLLILFLAEDNDVNCQVFCLQQGRQFKAVQPGEIGIDYGDVGLMLEDSLQAGIPLGGFGNDIEPFVLAQKLTQTPSAQWVFVYNGDTDFPAYFGRTRGGGL